MKREETIRLHLEQYLEGKSEEEREAFLAKDLNRQYSAIMAWKRRAGLKKAAEGITAADLLKHIRSITRLIPLATSLTPRQVTEITEALDEAREMIGNYERDRARRELQELERQQKDLQSRIDMLKSKC